MFTNQVLTSPNDAPDTFGRVVRFIEDGSIVIESDDTEYVYKFDDKSNRYTIDTVFTIEKTPVTLRTSMTMSSKAPHTTVVGVPETRAVFVTREGHSYQRITNDAKSFGSSVSVHPFEEVLAVGAPDVGTVFIYEL